MRTRSIHLFIKENGKGRTLFLIMVPILFSCFQFLWSVKAWPAEVVLCGTPVSYGIHKMQMGTQSQPEFVGVWSGGIWNVKTCGALIVESMGSDGTARVMYVYGPVERYSKMPPTVLPRTALIFGNQLTFNDNEGGRFTFSLDGSELRARFIDSKGHLLQTTLTKVREIIIPPDYPRTSEPPTRSSSKITDGHQPTSSKNAALSIIIMSILGLIITTITARASPHAKLFIFFMVGVSECLVFLATGISFSEITLADVPLLEAPLGGGLGLYVVLKLKHHLTA